MRQPAPVAVGRSGAPKLQLFVSGAKRIVHAPGDDEVLGSAGEVEEAGVDNEGNEDNSENREKSIDHVSDELWKACCAAI